MKLHFNTVLGCIVGFLSVGSAAPTWPAAIDELEDVMFLNTGYKSRGFSSHITPCSFSEFGPGRQTAAEWLRIGFHDMSTTNIFFEPHGGIDGSIAFELQNGENIGAGFETSLNTYSSFFNSRLSVSDMIALGVYASVRGCGGPVVPMRGGRVDATAAGPMGVPQPQNAQGIFVNQFARMGFNSVDMIQMTACGHTLGGVHAGNFPNIVTPGTAPDDYHLFDTTLEFDNNVAVQYVNGQTTNPLVVGPSVASTRNSDFVVFNTDKNVTIKTMTNAQTFQSVCSSILQRMIETVPPTVPLSDIIQPYEVKPAGLQLTLLSGGTQIQFSGDIRVRTTVRSASQIATVQLTYKDRTGGSACGSCSITTSVSGTANGFDDSFSFYSFSSNLPATSSISSFTVVITGTDGTTETYDNNASGFPIQDSVIALAPQSCLSNGNLTVFAAVHTSVTTPVSVSITQKVPRAAGTPVPALVSSSVAMIKRSTVGQYDIYSASYTISSATGTKYGVSSGSFTDDFKDATSLGSTCAPLGTAVPSSSSSSSSATSTSSSSSSTAESSSSTSSSLTSSSTSTSATSTPTLGVKPTIGAYTFQGCYTEGTGVRALSGASFYSYPDMTLEMCATNCAGFTYWGVEYGGECYCGNTLDATSTMAALNDCNFICPGNSYEYCGAGNRLELYKLTSAISSTSSISSSTKSSSSSTAPTSSSSSTSPTEPPTTSTSSSSVSSTEVSTSSSTSPSASPTLHIVPSAGPYKYLGCYTEGEGVRALGSASYPSDTQTIEACAAACAPYKYAGAEYGRECWCADSFGAGSVLVPDSDCSMTCAGSQYEYCGAGNRLTVYVMNGTDTTGPLSSTSRISNLSLGPSTFGLPKSSSTTRSTTSSSKTTSPTVGSSTATPSSSSTLTTSTKSSSSAVSTQTAAAIKQNIGDYTYYGCQTEGTGVRALSGAASFNYTSMTLEMCAESCAGYKYWGVEYGGECYCGNTFNTGSAAAPEGDKGCSFLCPGDKLEYCGAGNRLSAYVLNA
ncbi:uncharacterized protein BP5553_04085 [Venustampulla echinocandica]|uniref:Heme peroxidase n=1 Tax=Venustampulla echinocandica TaxID=2656787 RepID=A0A370TW43_9HELO|nr:uncharacterized protein BP5553_04085 [Venustampulla echinocandica]RDL39745.1 hypothetical protein BP5553_04085 [Venustampulla echinocandica]